MCKLSFGHPTIHTSTCHNYKIPIMVSYGRTYRPTDIHTYRRTRAVYGVSPQLKSLILTYYFFVLVAAIMMALFIAKIHAFGNQDKMQEASIIILV